LENYFLEEYIFEWVYFGIGVLKDMLGRQIVEMPKGGKEGCAVF
jgi:molybdenum-dependent DNA-binding transcriptional regulator ModE